MTDTTENKTENREDSRYLLFHLGEELFGTPLMGVREVVELQKIKPIPHTSKSFLGVINIRGEIVGTIDLRIRFGLAAQDSKLSAMMVFATSGGPIAAIADRLEGVAHIDGKHMDLSPRIETKVPLVYLIGIAKVKEKLVTLIDLSKVLDAEEVATLKSKVGEPTSIAG